RSFCARLSVVAVVAVVAVVGVVTVGTLSAPAAAVGAAVASSRSPWERAGVVRAVAVGTAVASSLSPWERAGVRAVAEGAGAAGATVHPTNNAANSAETTNLGNLLQLRPEERHRRKSVESITAALPQAADGWRAARRKHSALSRALDRVRAF